MPGIKAPLRQKSGAGLSPCWHGTIDDHVIAVAWTPDGKTLAAASIGGPITLYDSESGTVRHHLSGHGFGTTAIAWNGDGRLLASSGQDGKVRLWDAESGEARHVLHGGAAWVERVAWCAERSILASAAGKRLRLWSPDGDLIREFDDHPSTIADIAWKPRSTHITAAAYGGLTIWSVDDEQPVVSHSWQGSTLAISWSPDGKYIATGDQDSTVHFWVAKSGQDFQMFGYPMKVRELSWNSSSRYLATGGGITAVIWDCSGKGPEGTKPQMLSQHDEPISALAFQPVGSILATAGQDGRVVLWRPGIERRSLCEWRYDAGISTVAWSPDSARLAVATESGDVGVLAVS